jgi:hypothetical protein
MKANSTSTVNRDIENIINHLGNVSLDRQSVANEKQNLKITEMDMKIQIMKANFEENERKLRVLNERSLNSQGLAVGYTQAHSNPVHESNTSVTIVLFMIFFVLLVAVVLLIGKMYLNHHRQNFHVRGTPSEINTLREHEF